MYHLEHPITPSQQATNGALSIYVEAGKKSDLPRMLIGLSVLKHATEQQIQAAMPVVAASLQVSRSEIEAMLAQ